MVTCIVAVIVGRGRGARVSTAEALVAVGGVGLVEVVEHLLAEGGGTGREPLPLRRRGLQFALSISFDYLHCKHPTCVHEWYRHPVDSFIYRYCVKSIY